MNDTALIGIRGFKPFSVFVIDPRNRVPMLTNPIYSLPNAPFIDEITRRNGVLSRRAVDVNISATPLRTQEKCQRMIVVANIVQEIARPNFRWNLHIEDTVPHKHSIMSITPRSDRIGGRIPQK
jgi:hypothetical protein